MSGATCVAPTATRPATALTFHHEWLYELRGANELPTIDLSISLESRFLGRRALDRMKRCVRQQRQLGIAAWIALACYFTVVLVPAAVGRVVAIPCVVLWMPAIVAAHALLRYHVLLLLYRSYDFWFCTCVNTATFLVLGILLGGDSWALAALAAWAGVQINVVIDANIRAVKLWAMLDVVGVVSCALTWVALSLGLLDEVCEFRLLYYGAHELPATGFVASGLLTVTALLARNVYRKREVFFKRANRAVVECVSYRVNVRFQVYELQERRAVSAPLPPTDPLRPEYEKKMKFARRIGVLNARCTVFQWLAQRYYRHRHEIQSDSDSDEHGWLSCVQAGDQGTRLRWLGISAIGASIASVFVDVYYVPVTSAPLCQLGALALTLLYGGICGLHYQRQLLRELSATFDALFLSAQLLVVHAGAGVLFQFNRATVAVLITGLWFLWLLLLDSTPPVIKTRLGITRSLVLLVVVVLLGASVALIYLLVFAPTTDVRDCVLWHGRILGRDVEFRLVPIFYNSLGTALCLVLRILWRVVANVGDVLLMIDGAVVYENYLRTARAGNSRRWGSITRASANGSLAAGLCLAPPRPERGLSLTMMTVTVAEKKELR